LVSKRTTCWPELLKLTSVLVVAATAWPGGTRPMATAAASAATIARIGFFSESSGYVRVS
jgi:hypothetical protein